MHIYKICMHILSLKIVYMHHTFFFGMLIYLSACLFSAIYMEMDSFYAHHLKRVKVSNRRHPKLISRIQVTA